MLAVLAPTASAASSSFSRSAWIPYWKDDAGIAEIAPYLSELDSVSPFVFEVNAEGKVVDRAGLGSAPWADFLKEAERKRVDVYPTVSWFNGAAMQATLSDRKLRAAHVKDLMSSVISSNRSVDGIEIDYEAKLAETNPHFVSFLKELGKALHKKKKDLICTIEARTPKTDLYPAGSPLASVTPVYANDYDAIDRYCDQVRVMAYDQGRAVVSLNAQAAAAGAFYAPVADPAWVRKVVASTTTQIAPSKIVLGMPTYGRVYRLGAGGAYNQISAITYPKAIALAQQQRATVVRGRSGELGFVYTGLTSGLPGNAVPTGTVNTYYVTFPDGGSTATTVALARELGLGGVALFKADGETDPATWDRLFR